jgi:hypothetical protein
MQSVDKAPNRGEVEMHNMISGQTAWVIVPALILVGAAYLWVVSRLLSRKTEREVREDRTSVRKAA